MSAPLRILVVEDDPLTAMTIEESLEGTGYVVCGKAVDHASAMAVMKKESPDLAIVDIELAGQPDGIITAQDLLRIKPIPLLYLTAHTDQEMYKRAKKTNPVAFLHKPFRPRELAMQIDLALTNYYEGDSVDLASTSDHLYVPDGRGKCRIYNKDIIYLQADKAYVELFMTGEELDRLKKNKNPFIISVGLGHILGHLPDNFYRLSRSIAINLNHLDRIETSRIFLGEHEIPLPEGTYQKLVDSLNAIRSRKRR